MKYNKTFFDWEDEFNTLEDLCANIYINDELKVQDFFINRIAISRNNADELIINFNTNSKISIIINTILTQNIQIKFEFLKVAIPYTSIIINNAMCITENHNFVKDTIETTFKVTKIEYTRQMEQVILKEWYGCCNKLNFHNGIFLTRKYEEITTYKNGKSKSFKLHNKSEHYSSNAFWIKLKNYKFKVSINDIKDTKDIYNKYTIEYRKEWGMIPNEDIRQDISHFLSFIIGTKLVKFGETGFDSHYIVRKQYISPSQMDRSLLYQTNFEFYNTDYRKDDTDFVIKQIPKMLNKYFKLKEKYRLNEILASLYIHSYLNFNFINYVTYIEMFSNINQKEAKLKTVVSTDKFETILKKLNSITGIPKEIREKFSNLNNIGIGKKVQKLLKTYKINYASYKDVFKIRGQVIHGTYVEIEDMYKASEKAKELLTILTLKKLGYIGYIRNFTNNDELIDIKDCSSLLI